MLGRNILSQDLCVLNVFQLPLNTTVDMTSVRPTYQHLQGSANLLLCADLAFQGHSRDWACVVCVCVMRAHFAEKRHGINSIIFWFSEGRRQSLEEERTAIRLFWKTVSTSAARSRETKKKNFLCVMCVCVCEWSWEDESWTSLCALLTRLTNKHKKNCKGAVAKAALACSLAKGKKPGMGVKHKKGSFSSHSF